jgi:ArsR family metal-binding transcriptional regulator
VVRLLFNNNPSTQQTELHCSYFSPVGRKIKIRVFNNGKVRVNGARSEAEAVVALQELTPHLNKAKRGT